MSEQRPWAIYCVFVRTDDAPDWTLLGMTVKGRTQDEGKRRAAEWLGQDATYGPLIQSTEGLHVAVVSERSWKPTRFGASITVRALD